MTVPRPSARPRLHHRGRPSALAARLASLAAATGIAAAAVLAVPGTAAAHGVAMVPGSRTYLCYKDLLANSSTQMPANPACRAAVQEAGTTPLYNWFAVLDSNAGGRGEGYVDDGTLCSAGDRSPYDFSPYNAARTDWPVTHLTASTTIEVDYSNWAHHPGRFEVYVTKDGFDPEQPLGWADLEKVQTVQNPPHEGGPGTEAGHYYWDLQLPDRTGRHIMFIQWIRSDSQENFFSCSDLVFDGGNGEVTGLTGNGGSARAVTANDAGQAHTSAHTTAHSPAHSTAHTAGHATAHSATDSSGTDRAVLLAGSGSLAVIGGVLIHLRRRALSDDR
ncbi:lytic polysaccharide monooxygenase auxiliary activity family 9 protein [Streptomyces longispororuber]|uniref:lytic polysaccharide monooxygenase auxiliary activity family 9 protein n=1 Tax=Streptomyces longispororuber TaxID=68230 RepID=UPI00210D0EBC|nr:lytic polysaccharide monooxygenase [Streptomyces longispororuber]MCQ4206905.1 lytic polysaccharide monooxygenase [Streptomyces longispororuber]